MKILLLVGVLGLSGCAHFKTVGEGPYCLNEYMTGLKMCRYPTMAACKEDMTNNTMCVKR